MRTCTGCGETKTLESFWKQQRVKDGRRSKCIACMTTGIPPGPVPIDPLTRYILNENGCWIWPGKGYGSIKWNGTTQAAHRVIWQILIGPIPAHTELDHLCRVVGCVNPSHLEPVTHKVNMERGAHAIKTHCKNGHLFEGENLILRKGGTRACRQCLRRAQRAYKEKIRDKCGVPA